MGSYGRRFCYDKRTIIIFNMASDNDITVRKRRCKDVFDGDLAHYIPGSSDDA